MCAPRCPTLSEGTGDLGCVHPRGLVCLCECKLPGKPVGTLCGFCWKIKVNFQPPRGESALLAPVTSCVKTRPSATVATGSAAGSEGSSSRPRPPSALCSAGEEGDEGQGAF